MQPDKRLSSEIEKILQAFERAGIPVELIDSDKDCKPYQINGHRPCQYGDPCRGKDFEPRCYTGTWRDSQRVQVVDGVGTCPTCGRMQVYYDYTHCRADKCSGWVKVDCGRGSCDVCGIEHLFSSKPTNDELPADDSGIWVTWWGGDPETATPLIGRKGKNNGQRAQKL